MIKNYLKIALRNIKRYSAHSILNVSGMAIGMACSILLLLWIRYQISFDRFRANADNLFRVTTAETWVGRFLVEATTPFPLAAALKEEYPEIIRSTRFHTMQVSFQKGNDLIKGYRTYADKDFLDMFDIEFVLGDKASALTKPNDILVTEEMASKYFGKEDPLGKIITIWPNDNYIVAGIIKNTPRNSNFYLDCIIPAENYGGKDADSNVWGWQFVYNYTFVELGKGVNIQLLENKIKDVIQRNRKGTDAEISLQNIREIHLNAKKYEGDFASGNKEYVKFAILLAILILTIACINFMSLLTAQSSGRAKEIGVRKMAGAGRSKIVFQFLGESLLIVFIAHIIAMILVEIFLPGFNNLLRTNLEVNYLDPGLYLSLFIVIIFSGFLAGSYPAFYLSSLKPLDTIRGKTDENPGKARFRKILVISQFTLSFLFITCTIIVRNQLSYIYNADLGQNIDQIGYFEIPKDVQSKTLKNELANIPEILNVTIANTQYQSLVNHQLIYGIKNWNGKQGEDTVSINGLSTDKNYAETFQLEMKKGQFLSSDEYIGGESGEINIVINEKAALFFGMKEAIGGEVISASGRKLKIIGVVKDFHYRNMRFPIEPLIIFPLQSDAQNLKCYFKMKPDDINPTLNAVRNTVKKFKPDYLLDIKFLEDDFYNLYFVERAIATVLGYITILAIIISCLGLVGLSAFMIARRTKEIGIRKANGAKSGEIFSMLSKEYISLITVSFIIASPIAWFATNMWLRSFAYRTNVGLWVFALAFVIVIIITMLTVGFQSYRAAAKNPVEALRYE
jgi:putative ABC transport system permease protein